MILHLYGSRERIEIDPLQVKAVLPVSMGDGFEFSEIVDWKNHAVHVIGDAKNLRRCFNEIIHNKGKRWWIKGVEE